MKSIPVLSLFKIENKFMIAGLALLQFFLVVSSSFWLHTEESVDFSLLKNLLIKRPE